MPIDPKKSYSGTTSKLRYMWEIAMRLIAAYEDFDSRLTSLENKVKSISIKLNSTIQGS